MTKKRINYGSRPPTKEPTLDTPINRINKKIEKFLEAQPENNKQIINLYEVFPGSIIEPFPSYIQEYTRLLRIKAAIERGDDEIIAHLSA